MADPDPSAGNGGTGPSQTAASGEPDEADSRAGAAVAAARLSLAGLLGRWRNRLLKRNGGTLRESLEGVIEEHDEAIEDFSAHERAMLANILEFGDIRADDVMVPRADIVALEISTPLEDAVDVFNQAFHSRLPVYQATLDNPLGMVHIKDLMAACIETDETVRQNFTLTSIRRDILYVPPSMRALDLLLKMRTTRIHMALVIDEYGGTDGLLTIEDLVEEIVGDIEDEHDEAGPVIRARSDGSYEADARVPLEDFEHQTGIAIVSEDLAEEVDTVGGAVVALIGRVPQRGELIEQAPGLEIEIVDADPRTIKRLRVRPLPAAELPEPGERS